LKLTSVRPLSRRISIFPTSEVGEIEIRRDKGRTEVNFKLDERLANQGETRTPIDHKLRLSAPSKSETIGILCRSKKFEDGREIEERSVEGTIVQVKKHVRADCRAPIGAARLYQRSTVRQKQ
jgi:hypothetical protein